MFGTALTPKTGTSPAPRQRCWGCTRIPIEKAHPAPSRRWVCRCRVAAFPGLGPWWCLLGCCPSCCAPFGAVILDGLVLLLSRGRPLRLLAVLCCFAVLCLWFRVLRSSGLLWPVVVLLALSLWGAIGSACCARELLPTSLWFAVVQGRPAQAVWVPAPWAWLCPATGPAVVCGGQGGLWCRGACPSGVSWDCFRGGALRGVVREEGGRKG